MPGDDALYGGEADTGSFEFAGRVQPLEDAKELAGVGHVETGAVVANEVDRPALLPVDTELDPGRRLLARELPGIAQQVLEGGTEETWIGIDADTIGDDELDLVIRSGLAQRPDDLVHELREVERLANQLATRGARKLQEIFDELRHPRSGLVDEA